MNVDKSSWPQGGVSLQIPIVVRVGMALRSALPALTARECGSITGMGRAGAAARPQVMLGQGPAGACRAADSTSPALALTL